MDPKHFSIGIDVGTVTTSAAVFRSGKAELVLHDGQPVMPSCVAFTEFGRIIGPGTEDMQHLPDTLYDILELIGRDFSDPVVQKLLPQRAYHMVDKCGKLVFRVQYQGSQHDFSPVDVLAMILGRVKRDALRQLGQGASIVGAVITLPIAFNLRQRQAVWNAALIARLRPLHLISSPVAMCTSYLTEHNAARTRNVLFADFGAQSFNVCIARLKQGRAEIKSSAGESSLGGENINQHLVDFLYETLRNTTGSGSIGDGRTTRRLESAAAKAKHTLSSQPYVTIEIDAITKDVDFRLILSRSRLEYICNGLFQRALDLIKSVLADARISKRNIHTVILSGGSSRVPKIHSTLSQHFGTQKTRPSTDREASAAKGAAVYAAILKGEYYSTKGKHVAIVDVVPHAIGLGLGGNMVSILHKNDRLPVTKTFAFPTFQSRHGTFSLRLFEGNSLFAQHNFYLGLIPLNTAPRGIVAIEVVVQYSADGRVVVQAMERGATRKERLVLVDPRGFHADGLKFRAIEAERMDREDEAEAWRTASQTTARVWKRALESSMAMRVDEDAHQSKPPSIHSSSLPRPRIPSPSLGADELTITPQTVINSPNTSRRRSSGVTHTKQHQDNHIEPLDRNAVLHAQAEARVQEGYIPDPGRTKTFDVEELKGGENEEALMTTALPANNAKGHLPQPPAETLTERYGIIPARTALLHLAASDVSQEYSSAVSEATLEPILEPILEHSGTQRITPPLRHNPMENIMADLFHIDRGKPTHFTDVDFEHISTYLETTGQRSWSTVPRLYTVLRLIGKLDALDTFTDQGFTDVWFPFVHTNLPSILSPSDRASFLENQEVVLSKSLLFEKGVDRVHAHFGVSEPVPFRAICKLGEGAHAVVEKVVSTVSHREYARKLFRRPRGLRKNDIKTFVTELQVLKKLDHFHCIELIQSYSDPKYFALLMSPIASCNLYEYYALAPTTPTSLALLTRFLGCLTNALQYLHSIKIRHRDIKPHNILVKGERILFTDFGIALDWENLSRATTTADSGKTLMYAAPEVIKFECRNAAADVWSLGCVFLEIATVVVGQTVECMRAFFAERSGNYRFYANIASVAMWMDKLRGLGARNDQVVLTWAEAMLQEDAKRRSTAAQLYSSIAAECETKGRVFCGACCLEVFDSSEDEVDGEDDSWVRAMEGTADA